MPDRDSLLIVIIALLVLALTSCGKDNETTTEKLSNKEAISCRDKNNGLHYWTHSEVRGSCVVQCVNGIIKGLRCKNWKGE